ncbi:O-antigen ligase family protein [Cryomorphaceae bacterium]|nr:O-antigen ligase family protein [Cryomorphaceae bacterium]
MAKRASKKSKPGNNEVSGVLWPILAVGALTVISFAFNSEARDQLTGIRLFYSGLTGGAIAVLIFAFKPKMASVSDKGERLFWMVFAGLLVWTVVTSMMSINSTEGTQRTVKLMSLGGWTYLLAYVVYQQKSSWEIFVRGISFLGAIHAGAAILNYYEIAPTLIKAVHPSAGYMVNRNMQGSFIALMFPFAIAAALSSTRNRVIDLLNVSIFILLSWALIIAKTRSAWLSVAVIAIACLVFLISKWRLFEAKERKSWIKAIVYATGTPLLVFILLTQVAPDKSVRDRGSRMANVVSGKVQSDGSASARLDWNLATLEMIGDYPVTGVGPGLWRLYISDYNLGSGPNQKGTATRARLHNDYLQMGAERGIIGLFLFLCLATIAVWLAVKRIRKSDYKWGHMSFIGLLGLLSFGVDMLFSFPLERVVHPVVLASLIGMIIVPHSDNSASRVLSESNKSILAVVILSFFFVGFVGREIDQFNVKMGRTIAFKNAAGQSAQYWTNSLEEAQAGKSAWISMDETCNTMELYEGIALKNLDRFDEAIEALERGLKYYPRSPRMNNMMASVYTEINDFEKAAPYYEIAFQSTPLSQSLRLNYAINEYYREEYAKVLELLDGTSYKDYPSIVAIYESAQEQVNIQNLEKEKAPPTEGLSEEASQEDQ